MRETCGWVVGGVVWSYQFLTQRNSFQSMPQQACLCRFQCQINTFNATGLRYCPFLDYIMVRSMTTFSNAHGLRYCTPLGYVSVRSWTTFVYAHGLRYCIPPGLRYCTSFSYVIVRPLDYVIIHSWTTLLYNP